MNTMSSLSPICVRAVHADACGSLPPAGREAEKAEFQRKFNEVLGTTMYGLMLKSLRKTSHKTPYFNGGRTEEVFGQQLDRVLAEKMGRRDAGKLNHLSCLTSLARK